MGLRAVAKLSLAPLVVGLVGAVLALGLLDAANALGFAGGALLIAGATFVSNGFYLRVQARTAGRVMIRLALSSALKWLMVMGGAGFALTQMGLAPAAFTCGVIAGLVSTLFNTVQTSTGATRT